MKECRLLIGMSNHPPQLAQDNVGVHDDRRADIGHKFVQDHATFKEGSIVQWCHRAFFRSTHLLLPFT
jgi:hypothetical protein